jgi:hypothetical protein
MRANSRGPAQQPNPYYADDDEDMDDDDHGSSTDPYDSEMTNEIDAEELAQRHGGHLAGRRDTDEDGDIDIDVYEDELDDLDEVDTDGDSQDGQHWHGTNTHLAQQDDDAHHGQGYAPGTTLPEDEPWPGIEDHMSDGENVDPLSSDEEEGDVEIGNVLVGGGHDGASDASSQPSEYPSTQRAWHVTDEGAGPSEAAAGQEPRRSGEGEVDSGIGFHIHEDLDTDVDLETQWA